MVHVYMYTLMFSEYNLFCCKAWFHFLFCPSYLGHCRLIHLCLASDFRLDYFYKIVAKTKTIKG